MFSLFRRSKVRIDVPRLKPKRDTSQSANRVNLAELTPEVLPYLGQAAYIQLWIFESLSRAVSEAPDLQAKELLGSAAGQALDKHQRLMAEIRRRVDVPTEVMEPFAVSIEEFGRVVEGADWFESIASIYLTAGILDDFFILLSAGLDGDAGPKAAQIIDADSGRNVIVDILMNAMAKHPTLGSRLALWGRRLVGDTLLLARSAIHLSGNADSDEERIEPVFTELIAAHSRRMDGLGLTA